MMDELLRSLASELTPGGPGGDESRLRLRQGTIVSVAANGTATVTIGGDSTALAGVKVASHVCPIPGATCWLAVDGRDAFVVATLAPSGPAFATMRRTSGGNLADSTFAAIGWNNITETESRGLTIDATGFIVQVPGIYQVTGQVQWAANNTGGRLTRIIQNGNIVSQGVIYGVAAATTPRQNVTALLRCAIGDVINLELWQNSGGALGLTYNAGSNIMSALWLAP